MVYLKIKIVNYTNLLFRYQKLCKGFGKQAYDDAVLKFSLEQIGKSVGLATYICIFVGKIE